MNDTPFSLVPQALLRREKQILWLSLGLLLPAMLWQLGVQPLFLEEPRRIMIALEMAENGNGWAPTELGDFYYKKPPVFNWILLASSWLCGGYSEFAFRLPTVLSTLLLTFLVFLLGRRYVGERFGAFSALLFLTGGGILLYFSTLAEIDLFYSLVTFASFATFFHYYQIRQYWAAFLLTYTLGAIGTLTKGPPSVLFLGLTIFAWLAWKRDLKRLFSLAHLTGAALYLGLLGGYLYIYSHYNSLSNYFPGLWGQSSEMTILERSFGQLLRHLVNFPLDTIKDLMPAGLLLVFCLRRDFWKVARQNDLIVFALITFAVNIPAYWLSPGARQRYIYMLYPMLLYVFVYFQQAADAKKWMHQWLRITLGVVIGALTLAPLAINFVPDLDFMPFRLPLSLGFTAVMGAVFYVYWRKPGLALPLLILSMIIARILFDATVLPQRAHDSGALREKQLAAEILKLSAGSPLYMYGEGRISFTSTVYIGLMRGKALRRRRDIEPGVCYLAETQLLAGRSDYETLLTFEYNRLPHALVRIK
ncbi:MAG: glycosyltransferase family 39 protein [Saprospiraceae bacterium]|nr:glycosyltransferase family 39 protein [Saprospiraceae bacterium]